MKPFRFNILLFLVIFLSGLFAAPGEQNTSPGLPVESIEIIGNTKTRKEVILNLLDFRPGERINQQTLNRNLERLKDSNFFKKVSLYTQPGSQAGQIRVFVEVQERRWPYLQFRGGYNELDGWFISPLGIRLDNFFGRGNYLGGELFIGDRVTGIDLSYLRPRIFGSDLNLRILLFTRQRQFVHYLEEQKYLQYVNLGGLSVRITGNHGIMKYLWFELISENGQAEDYMWKPGQEDQPFPLPPLLSPFTEKLKINRFILSLNKDSRNNRSYPTSGWWGSLSLNQVSRQLGAYTDYKKVILDIRRYQGIMNEWVLALRLKGGWIDEAAPFYEKFYLGGPNSLRGYADRSLNPFGYASRLFQGSVEFRFPVTRKRFPRQILSGVFFYDFGQAWNPPAVLQAKEIHTSVGFGFRLRLPFVGIVRLDFAYPIPEYTFKFHLSLGHTF